MTDEMTKAELPELPPQHGYIVDGIPHMLRFKRGETSRSDALVNSTMPVYTANQMRAYGQAATRQALERAAKVCEHRAGRQGTIGRASACMDCADAIRAMEG